MFYDRRAGLALLWVAIGLVVGSGCRPAKDTPAAAPTVESSAETAASEASERGTASIAQSSDVASGAVATTDDGSGDLVLDVVATTTIIADVARAIGGERIRAISLMESGDDPHGFQLTPRHMILVDDADLVLANGLGLEPFLDRLEASLPDGRVIRLSDDQGVDSSTVEPMAGATLQEAQGDHEPEHDPEHGADEDGDHPSDADEQQRSRESDDQHAVDPHVWFVPDHVAKWGHRMADAFARLDPDHADDFEGRAVAYEERMHALDDWIAERIGTIPAERRILVTDHAVLDQFAARYGLDAVGSVIPAHSPLAQPSAAELARLQDAVGEHGAPAIFVGVNTPSRVADRLAEDVGVPVVRIHTGGLSDADGAAGDYESFMRTNVELIVEALR